MPDASFWEAEASGSSITKTGVQTHAQKQIQAFNPIKWLIIHRTEPRSPILVSAIGSDLDANVFHKESEALGLHVSVEDVENRESARSEVSDEPYIDSFSIPAVMATPAGLDDLIQAMRDLMCVQMQQMAQMTQLQQQLTVTLQQL